MKSIPDWSLELMESSESIAISCRAMNVIYEHVDDIELVVDFASS